MPGVTHVDLKLGQDRADLIAGAHKSGSFRLQVRQQRGDPLPVKIAELHVDRAVRLKAERRAQEPDSRANARPRRHQQTLHPQLFTQTPCMQRGRAAKGDHRVFRQVLAVFNCMHAGGVGHVFIDHFGHTKGRLDRVHIQRVAHVVGQRRFGILGV